jgi:hypothetical protein
MDGCGKSRLPPGFDPRTVQDVASRYTNCPNPAPDIIIITIIIIIIIVRSVKLKAVPVIVKAMSHFLEEVRPPTAADGHSQNRTHFLEDFDVEVGLIYSFIRN